MNELSLQKQITRMPTNNNFQALAGREDAYFIASTNWLGVADGVGQWSFEGDPFIIPISESSILFLLHLFPGKCLI